MKDNTLTIKQIRGLKSTFCENNVCSNEFLAVKYVEVLGKTNVDKAYIIHLLERMKPGFECRFYPHTYVKDKEGYWREKR